jgi:endonuclease YncB( thermonuclease family)
MTGPGCETSDCPLTHDTGLAQVKAGMAWWYRKYAREQTPEDQALYEKAEDDAKADSVGLWSEPDPVAPWVWRRR